MGDTLTMGCQDGWQISPFPRDEEERVALLRLFKRLCLHVICPIYHHNNKHAFPKMMVPLRTASQTWQEMKQDLRSPCTDSWAGLAYGFSLSTRGCSVTKGRQNAAASEPGEIRLCSSQLLGHTGKCHSQACQAAVPVTTGHSTDLPLAPHLSLLPTHTRTQDESTSSKPKAPPQAFHTTSISSDSSCKVCFP